MKSFINGKRIAMLFFLALSIFACQQAVVIGLGSIKQPGSGLLPFIAGFLVGVFSIILLFQSNASQNQKRVDALDEKLPRKLNYPLIISLSLFGYAIAINYIGFLLSTFVFVIFIYRLVESEKWWRSVIEAALISIANYLLFIKLFNLYLPEPFWAW